MKELSIEEKAKRYDEVMGRAKKELDACGSQDCDAARQIFRLFPELKESEDERIRKHLIGVVELYYGNTDEQEKKDCLDWLERQGEQKPTWSEEDGKMIQDIINDIAIAQEQVYCKSRCEDEINWLKSLKDRVQVQSQWKPSDEQIDALEDAIADAVSSIQKNMLNSLYSDLKKLREE